MVQVAANFPGSRNIVSVRDFGADRTGTDDSSAAFIAAADALGPINGTVRIPAGVYKVANLPIRQGLRWTGDGIFATQLKPSGTYQTMFRSADSTDVTGAGLYDLRMTGDAVPDTGSATAFGTNTTGTDGTCTAIMIPNPVDNYTGTGLKSITRFDLVRVLIEKFHDVYVSGIDFSTGVPNLYTQFDHCYFFYNSGIVAIGGEVISMLQCYCYKNNCVTKGRFNDSSIQSTQAIYCRYGFLDAATTEGYAARTGQGTVSTVGAATLVNGAGTKFLGQIFPGQTITANGNTGTVATVISDTQLTLTSGTNFGTAQTYTFTWPWANTWVHNNNSWSQVECFKVIGCGLQINSYNSVQSCIFVGNTGPTAQTAGTAGNAGSVAALDTQGIGIRILGGSNNITNSQFNETAKNASLGVGCIAFAGLAAATSMLGNIITGNVMTTPGCQGSTGPAGPHIFIDTSTLTTSAGAQTVGNNVTGVSHLNIINNWQSTEGPRLFDPTKPDTTFADVSQFNYSNNMGYFNGAAGTAKDYLLIANRNNALALRIVDNTIFNAGLGANFSVFGKVRGGGGAIIRGNTVSDSLFTAAYGTGAVANAAFNFFNQAAGENPTMASQIFDNMVSTGGSTNICWVDSSGTPGNATAHTTRGKAAIAAAATACTITTIFAVTQSTILCQLQTTDATATAIKSVIPASGSFTINVNAAATGTTNFCWEISHT